MPNPFVALRRKKPENYKGLVIHADTGVHAQAADLVQEYIRPGASVLDVGAGAGAFSLRLKDLGYSVVALDIDASEWPSDAGMPFYQADLEKGIPYDARGPYDAVCCVEVIEHVESPWGLLRELFTVMNPGGYLFLSTPNVTSFLSRLLFLRSGRFHQFDDVDLEYGHITPLTSFHLSVMAERAGFRIVEVRPGGYLPILDFSSLRPAALLLNVLRAVTYPLMRGERRGWCLFFVLTRPDADTPSGSGPPH